MNDCVFYYDDNFCKILKVRSCNKCKFKKTKQEYIDGQARADERLKSKGLQKVMSYNASGEKIMSIRRIKNED